MKPAARGPRAFAVRTTLPAAPPALWALLTDAASWPAWNGSVSQVGGRIALNETVTLQLKDGAGGTHKMRVVAFEPPFLMVWQRSLPFGLFKVTRAFNLRPNGPAETAFDLREVCHGPLARWLGPRQPDQQPAFDALVQGLYDTVKAQATARQSP